MDGTARRPWGRAAAGVLRHGAVALAVFYLALLSWLAALAVVPAVVGWTPYVVTTGSMAPRIPPGAVVVASPAPQERVGTGTVIVFTDASGRTLTHRVVEVEASGRYRSRGDANAVADPEPVTHDQVRGVGRMLVPLVGLPVVWGLRGHWLALAAALASMAAAAHVGLRGSRRPVRAPGDPAPAVAAREQPGEGAGRRAVARRGVPVAAVALAVLALLGSAASLAGASFVGAATQPSNRWTAATDFSGFASFTASNLPTGATSASQQFTFTLTSPLPAGATVVIDLTAPYRGPVDYWAAAQPVSSAGTAALESQRGQSHQREARVVWRPPAGGWPAGATVTVTIQSGIATGAATGGLAAVATRSDTGATSTALFAVQ